MKQVFTVRLAATLLLACSTPLLQAATPSSGTLSTAASTLSYQSGPFNNSNQTAASGYLADPAGIVCNNMAGAKRATECDDFALTVNVTAAYLSANPKASVKVSVAWPDNTDDFDIYLLDSGGNYIGSSNGSDDPEQILFTPTAGSNAYTVRIVPGTVSGEKTATTITLNDGSSGGGGGGNQPPLPPNPTGPGVPRFRTYVSPPSFGDEAGEPSIGYNINTGRAMMIAATQTLQINFAQKAVPAKPAACDADWKDVSYTVTNKQTLDPILFTDFKAGRTFVSQLNSVIGASAANVGLNSLFAYTDDDGATWTPGQIGPPEGGYDHQTTGSGPYPAALSNLANAQVNKGIAVYYCSQGGVDAFCSRSDTGGLTFPSGIPVYSANDCGGLHGHVRVSPDGTVYLPNDNCVGINPVGAGPGEQGAAVSSNGGASWTIRRVPGSVAQSNGTDPSVGLAKDDTAYFCYVNGDGHPHVATSRDHMATFIKDVDIGTGMNIAHSDFPQAIAGDGDRAACAFIGTTSTGNDQAFDFPGTWYGFIATTYDRGATWTTVNVTPNKPVQRETGIWNQGGSVPQRNLLDFNEISIDENGAPVFGFADGCIGPCEITGPNSFTSKATIVRQTGGKTLFASRDAVEPSAAAPSCLAGERDTEGSYLNWLPPDNGGADISGYKIYRTAGSGNGTLIGTTGNKLSYNDRSADPTVANYTYRIIAINSAGDGLFSNSVSLPVGQLSKPETTCALPGLTVVGDPAGDTVNGQDAYDLTKVSIAEPQASDGKLFFLFKVKGGLTAPLPPNTRWAVLFNGPAAAPGGAEAYHVSMITDPAGQATFVYGTEQFFSGTIPGAPFTSGRQFTDTGALDVASGISGDNATIKLVAPMNRFGLGRGDVVNVIVTRVSQGTPALGSGSYRSVLQDSGGGGTYTTRSANFCMAQNPPTAALAATPGSGTKPLIVHFSGAASSDPDSIDTIASYTFNFGDGSEEVTSGSATADHTYTDAGTYAAKLVVSDSRGTRSLNTGQAVIDVVNQATNADHFTFIERVNVPVNTFVTSETVTLSGFTGSLSISIDGGSGQYSIDGAPFTNVVGSVRSGAKLVVRHISAAAENTAAISNVSVGSYRTSFKSTTATIDRVPDAFSFGSQSALNPGAVAESAVITLQNFDVASIVAGPDVDYRINGGSYTRANGTLKKGQTLQVRHTANSNHLGYTKTYLKVGGVVGYFTTRTK